MQTLRVRLSLNNLIVLTLGMTLAAALAWRAVSGLYISSQRDNLLAQARLIAAALQDQTLPENQLPNSQTSNLAPGIHTRLLTENGAVAVGLPFVDMSVQAPLAEGNASIPTSDLIQRPEIDSALKGIPATALRRVLDNQRVLYAAAPIQVDDGHITGLVYIATPLPATGLPANILLQLIGALLIAIFLASIAGQYLARQFTRPLEWLTSAAGAIAGGDLDARAPTEYSITELNSLGQTFNRMAESLRKSAETEKAFIADVTHELRTPLTVIKGTIETLEDGALDDREGRGPLLTSMGDEADRLIRLVNELLVITRADAGQLGLNLQPLDLMKIAETRCDTFQLLASRKKIKFVLVEPDLSTRKNQSAFYVLADPDRLSQVIDNLLDNAIRHSPENSTITITVREEDDGFECSITDQGAGIPAEHLPFIFQRFYRVEKSRDRNRGGAGLGLAIARALILAQGGNISAQSVEGQGTTITFWLSRTSSPQPHPAGAASQLPAS